jgi:hypothetical protein
MIKNIIICILGLGVALCWIKVDPECMKPNDPNSVIIEYECASLGDYENVPPEVVDECKSRAVEATTHNKLKI